MKLDLSALEGEARELLRLYSPQESILVSAEEVLALVRIALVAVEEKYTCGARLEAALRDAGLFE